MNVLIEFVIGALLGRWLRNRTTFTAQRVFAVMFFLLFALIPGLYFISQGGPGSLTFCVFWIVLWFWICIVRGLRNIRYREVMTRRSQ